MRVILCGREDMEDFMGGNCLGDKNPGEIVLGGNFLGGSCPGEDYSGAIIWGVKVRGGISWRGRGNCLGVVV